MGIVAPPVVGGGDVVLPSVEWLPEFKAGGYLADPFPAPTRRTHRDPGRGLRRGIESRRDQRAGTGRRFVGAPQRSDRSRRARVVSVPRRGRRRAVLRARDGAGGPGRAVALRRVPDEVGARRCARRGRGGDRSDRVPVRGSLVAVRHPPGRRARRQAARVVRARAHRPVGGASDESREDRCRCRAARPGRRSSSTACCTGRRRTAPPRTAARW